MTITSDLPHELSPIPPDDFAPLARIVLHEMAAEQGRQRRRIARDAHPDLLHWSRQYLPAYFTKPPSGMHRWLARKIALMQAARGTKINLLGPRGGAKSTIGALALPLLAAVERREPYIWIVSDTAHQACAHLENIKAELLHNPRLAQSYPDAVGRGPTWRRGTIVLRNGVAIEAFGTGQRLRGRRQREHRPSLIICDDLQNDSHILSSLQRQRSQTWFHGTLVNAGTPTTNIINLATALHRQALAMTLHGAFGWSSRIFQSIARWPQNMSLWAHWETIATDLANPNHDADAADFYSQHHSEMHAGARLLWPEVEDLYSLMRLRLQSGHTAFEREKQNSPINPDLCEWPESYFDENIWFDAWPSNLVVKTMALDPSKGSDARTSDYSALVLLGMDRNGIIYVEADLARRPTPEIVAHGTEWFRRFQPHAFACESNQFQDLLGVQFEVEFRRQNLLAARPVPIENRVPKIVRIRSLGPFLSTRRLRFKSNSPSTRMLVEQLMQFPIADHDDGPDALEMAINLANQIIIGRTFNDGLGNRFPISP
jgi:predicted phage terminase large subunit-like protein